VNAVLDASVALKWQFEDEEDTHSALVLLEDFIDGKIILLTLSLFPYEIVSGIHVAINRKRISEADGFKATNYLTSLGINLRPFEDLIETTFHMARRYNLSPYDCAYMALAEKEKCDFFTGDRKLFKAIKAHFAFARWIGDYPSMARH
jgi:predicted nucleic acid-binding protein